jgi:hypothetical protein
MLRLFCYVLWVILWNVFLLSSITLKALSCLLQEHKDRTQNYICCENRITSKGKNTVASTIIFK